MTGSYVPARDAVGAGTSAPPARQAQARVGSAVKLSSTQSEAVRGTRLLLRQHERTDLDELLATRLRAQPGPPVVAVIGEAKRGKSTLVNALLGQREMVPTGTDITTGVFVEVHCGAAGGSDSPDAPAGPDDATVIFVDGSTREVPLHVLRNWVAVGGNPDPGNPDAAGAADVVGVRVRTAAGRLPGAVLVDTPGAGGLDGGHARLALQACRRAALLVFVTDAGQPLSAPELAFLTEASRTVQRVVVALTKIDKYPAYLQIAAEIRSLLQRHAPRFAADPIVPVSAELALQAGTATGTLATELDEFSGLPALLTEAQQALGDRNALAVRNVLRTAAHSLEQLVETLQRGLAVANGAPEARAAAARERAELAELREQQQNWALYLDRDLRAARSRTVERLGHESDRLRHRWRERLEHTRGAYTRPVAQKASVELRADLQAMAGAATLDLQEAVGGLVERLLGREATLGLMAARPTGAPPGLGREAPAGLRNLIDPSNLLIANGAGAAGAAWLGAAAGGPVGWAAGAIALPALALISLYRQGQAAQRRLSEWATEEINRVRMATVAGLDDLVNMLKPEIVISYRALLASRISTLDKIVKEALEAERSDNRQRQKRITELELSLTAVRAQQEAVAALLG